MPKSDPDPVETRLRLTIAVMVLLMIGVGGVAIWLGDEAREAQGTPD